MTSNIQHVLKSAATSWPGVTVYFRESWGSDYYDIGGKYFALVGENKEGKEIVTMKGNPESNERLREQYSFIVPGYYTNKTHWNSVLVETSTLTNEEYIQLLRASYELVLSSFSKKRQEELIK